MTLLGVPPTVLDKRYRTASVNGDRTRMLRLVKIWGKIRLDRGSYVTLISLGGDLRHAESPHSQD